MAHGSYQEQIDHQVTISWAEFDEWRNFPRIHEVEGNPEVSGLAPRDRLE